MDPEKPSSDSSPESPSDRASARHRVERLTETEKSGRGESDGIPDSEGRGTGGSPAGDSPAGKPTGRARLTERQRREARERRRASGRSGRRTGAGASRSGRPEGEPGGNALSRGLRATWLEIRRTASYFRGLILAGLDRIGPAVRFLTAGVVAVLAAAGRGLSRVGRLSARAFSRMGSALLAADRVLTPRRALITVAGAGALALAASQFIDFRAIEIGQPGYDPIRDLTGAPRREVMTPIDAHSVSLLIAAALSLAGVAGLALTGKRLFAAAIALTGAATLALALLVDLPQGLDVAQAEISYSSVAAVLLSGFWIELAAGLVLAIAGLGLMVVTRTEGSRATDSRRHGSRQDRSGESRRPGGDQSRDRGPRPADAGGLP